LERACFGSVVDACLDAAAILDNAHGSRQRVSALLDRACEGGSTRACRKLEVQRTSSADAESEFRDPSRDPPQERATNTR
jgi:hypothetical protein